MHYFDNAATTRVSEAAMAAACEAMRQGYGNPSSLHSLGLSAADMLERAENTVRGLVSGKASVIFTSGGTEADNLALRGAVGAGARRGNNVVTTAIEHPAVLETLKAMERAGEIGLRVVSPGKDGTVAAEDIVAAVTDRTVLVSVMLVNNETGAVQPVGEAAREIKRIYPDCLVHTDAVQGLGKLPLDCGADLISISGHKIHAPKGIGALIVREGVRIIGQITGGGQQRGLRAGTENMPGIAAFEQAIRDITSEMEQKNRHISGLAVLLRRGLAKELPAARVIGGGIDHIMAISLPGAPGEVLMRMLEEDSVYVSAGSACSRGRRSHVLEAMGLRPEIIDSAVRVSLSGETMREDIEALLDSLKRAALRLRLQV